MAAQPELFQEVAWAEEVVRKALSCDEADGLRMDSGELLFQRCFSFTSLSARSVRMLHYWKLIAGHRGGTVNVEIMLRQDRWCDSFVTERYV